MPMPGLPPMFTPPQTFRGIAGEPDPRPILDQASTNLGVDLRQQFNLGGANATGGGSGTASLPPIAYPDAQAGVDAAFARGKDKAAQNARASLTGLREAMAGRNMLGSGVEAAGSAEIVGRAGQGVNEIIREQSIQDAMLANQRANQEYQGRIQQRGQDINVAQSNAQQQSQALQSLLNMAGILY